MPNINQLRIEQMKSLRLDFERERRISCEEEKQKERERERQRGREAEVSLRHAVTCPKREALVMQLYWIDVRGSYCV